MGGAQSSTNYYDYIQFDDLPTISEEKVKEIYKSWAKKHYDVLKYFKLPRNTPETRKFVFLVLYRMYFGLKSYGSLPILKDSKNDFLNIHYDLYNMERAAEFYNLPMSDYENWPVNSKFTNAQVGIKNKAGLKRILNNTSKNFLLNYEELIKLYKVIFFDLDLVDYEPIYELNYKKIVKMFLEKYKDDETLENEYKEIVKLNRKLKTNKEMLEYGEKNIDTLFADLYHIYYPITMDKLNNDTNIIQDYVNEKY